MFRASIRMCVSLLLVCSYLPLFGQQAGNNQKPATSTSAPNGTLNFIARWTGTTTLGNANIFQSTTNQVGINTSTPAAQLDVKGTQDVRDTLTLFPNSTHPAVALSGSVFKIGSGGLVTFVSGQTFPGAGTVTSVATGAGLTGGPITHTGTLSIASAGVTNAMLLHPSLTVTAGSGLSGGGSVALGSAVTLNNAGVLSIGTGSGLTTTGGQNPTLDVNTSVVPELPGVNFFTGFSDFDGNEPVWEVEVSNSGQGDAIIASNNSVDSSHPTLSLTNSDSTGAGDLILDAFGSSFGGECSMDVTGNLFCTGTLGAAAKINSRRQVGVYGVQSPENWIEDFGTGTLFGGVTTINLDPTFAKTISNKGDYHVFLTPAGECEGLYVASRSATSFEVRELKRGSSNVQFDYRIVAHRRGLETVRMPELKMGAPRTPLQQDGHVAGTR